MFPLSDIFQGLTVEHYTYNPARKIRNRDLRFVFLRDHIEEFPKGAVRVLTETMLKIFSDVNGHLMFETKI